MKTFVVAKRLIKQILEDKRSIGLMFVAPVFVLFLLNVILTSGASKADIDVVKDTSQYIQTQPNGGGSQDIFIKNLSREANTHIVKSKNKAIERLKANKSDGYVFLSREGIKVKVEGGDPSISGLVVSAVNKAVAGNMPQVPLAKVQKPKIEFLHGSKHMDMFDSMAPLMMGFFIFFFVFLLAGVSFLRERISGTLDRILATPLKRSEIVWGYFFGFGVFVAIQTIIVQLFMVYGLKVPNEGNAWLVLIINLILASGSLSLGTLLSAFARNEFQLFQFIPIIIVPQILFSGIFDLREAPTWVTALSKIFPLTYGADALRNVMIRGEGFLEVQSDVYILAGYAVLFIVLNILVLKKYRRA